MIGKKKNIFIVDGFVDEFLGDPCASSIYKIICAAYQLNMTSENNYVWFLPDRLPVEWWQEIYDEINFTCSSDELLKVLNRSFSIERTNFGNKEQIIEGNETIGDWLKTYDLSNNDPMERYIGFLWDACWTYVYALRQIMNESSELENFLHGRDYNRFKDIISQTNFEGVSRCEVVPI